MSTVKTNNVQVGQSGTATNNFTLYQPTSPDGTVRLGVGNSGATTADVLVATSGGNLAVGATSTTFGGNTQRFAVSGAKTYSEGQPRSQLIVSDSTAQAAGVGGAVMLVGVYDGSGNTTGFASVEAAKENGTSGNYAGALVLKSRSNGGNLTERARFNSTGALVLAGGTATADGIGITFPATQSASTDANTLDDYEEGTWTPSLGGNTTYNNQNGSYIKIGQLVYVFCFLNINTIGTGSTTTVSGLPFNVRTSVDRNQAGSINFFNSIATNVVSLFCQTISSSTTVNFPGLTAANGSVTNPITVFQSGTQIYFNAVYQTNT